VDFELVGDLGVVALQVEQDEKTGVSWGMLGRYFLHYGRNGLMLFIQIPQRNI